MKVKEAAAYLTARDYPCSPGTVRALAKAKKLRCYRPGVTGRGRMAFREAWLDEFLRSAEFGGPDDPPAPAAPERKPRDRPVAVAVPKKAASPVDWGALIKAERKR